MNQLPASPLHSVAGDRKQRRRIRWIRATRPVVVGLDVARSSGLGFGSARKVTEEIVVSVCAPSSPLHDRRIFGSGNLADDDLGGCRGVLDRVAALAGYKVSPSSGVIVETA